MEIRKENENKIQVILQEAELKDQQITINDFMQNNSVVENLVYDIALRYLGWTDEQIGETNVTFSPLSNNNIMLEFVNSNNIDFNKIKNHVDRMNSLCGESNEEKTTEGVMLAISSLSKLFETIKILNIDTKGSVYKVTDKKEYLISFNKKRNKEIDIEDILISEFAFNKIKISKGYLKEHCQTIIDNENILDIAKKLY